MIEQIELFDLPMLVASNMNASDEGSWRELLVCSDLFQRGFAVCPRWGNGGSPDLVIIGPEGAMARIEVKAEKSQRRIRWEDADVMAVVSQNKQLNYYWYDWDCGRKRTCDPVRWFKEHAICHAEMERRIAAIEYDMAEQEAMREKRFSRIIELLNKGTNSSAKAFLKEFYPTLIAA